jgi:glutamate/aspartate transport system permease protein
MANSSWNLQFLCNDIVTSEAAARCFGGPERTYLDWVVSAWGWTLSLAACAWIVALLLGSLVGTLRTVPGRGWQALANVWVEVFRNIPLIVQIFLWYHVVPALVPAMKDFPRFLLVVLALGFFTSARVAEQVRAGIQALPRGQMNAALAMGLTLPQAYRFVILPMAFRLVIPPLTSEAMNIIKNSSVAFAVSIAELTLFARQAGGETSMEVEYYLVVTLLYFASAFLVNRLMALIEKSVRLPGFVGSGK